MLRLVHVTVGDLVDNFGFLVGKKGFVVLAGRQDGVGRAAGPLRKVCRWMAEISGR
jgi:hypothetical protein